MKRVLSSRFRCLMTLSKAKLSNNLTNIGSVINNSESDLGNIFCDSSVQNQKLPIDIASLIDKYFASCQDQQDVSHWVIWLDILEK